METREGQCCPFDTAHQQDSVFLDYLPDGQPSGLLVANIRSIVIITKTDYGLIVIMEVDIHDRLTAKIELKLDEADLQAKTDSTRYTHEDVFSFIRNQIMTDNRNPKKTARTE